jgi:hypothetical protein
MSQSDELQHATAEVPAEVAYAAAVERANRTNHALILAEAQILVWKQRYVAAVQAGEKWEREAVRLKGEQDAVKGVNDATQDQDPAGYAGAVGQAD